MSQKNIDANPEQQITDGAQYTAPRLVIYGNVSDLTMAQAGSNFETVIGNNGSKSKPG